MEEREQRSPDTMPGTLKIFFSYAPGTGKTYAMLQEARREKARGVDVVVGYLADTIPPDTAALLEGLEQLPPCNRGGGEEFDLDGALNRRPHLLLVDCLAHSNAGGSRHAKRYQDVEELLCAGIDVYTTVNVQDLESLRDLVGAAAGIQAEECIPDQMFDRAARVELVDVEAEELLRRLTAVPGRMVTGLSEEQLSALREIALRRAAQRLSRAARRGKGSHAARAGEHVLICLSSAPSNARVIRAAARMAEAFHSSFTALFVQTPEGKTMGEEDQARLQEHLRLAEQMGARITTVYGDDPAVQIAEYARVSGVTKIVMGKVNHRSGLLRRREELADRLIRMTENADVYIIPDRQPLYRKKRAALSHGEGRGLNWRDGWKTLLILTLSTLVGLLFHYAGFNDANIITIYILGVIITAVWTSGHLYGALCALLSVGAFNYFFTIPRFTFRAADPNYPVTFLVMLLASFIAGTLASQVKNQARQAAQKAYATELLLSSNQKFQQGQSDWEILSIAAQQLGRLLGRPVFYALAEAGPLTFRSQNQRGEELPAGEVAQAAQWVLSNGKSAGATTDTFPDAANLYLPVGSARGVMAVMGIPMEGLPQPEAFERNLMAAMLSECGLILERRRLQAEKQAIELSTQQERLRANLLRAISHDLRTPLTSISGNAAMLMSIPMEEEKKQELYAAVYDDAVWLTNLTENLLAVTRMEDGVVHLQMAPELLEEVFQEALSHLDRQAATHRITVSLEDDLLMARMDVRLIVHVILNLVNNAVKYTPVGTDITLSAARRGEWVEVSVADHGPGVADEAKPHIFDRFYTAGQPAADSRRGLGLGLHLCQSIVHAHGGTISVEDNVPHGAIFRFILPVAEVNQYGESENSGN